MNVSLLIARRYFLSRKKGGAFNLISIISAISLLGYVVGAAALVIVLSVFNGFEILFQSMYNNFDSDLQITAASGKVFRMSDLPYKDIVQTPGVEVVSQVLKENVLLRYDDRQTIAKVKGVDSNFIKLTQLDSALVAGVLVLEDDELNFALVGQGIAWNLAIDPGNIFKNLIVYVPKRGETDLLDPEGSFMKAAIAPIGVFSVQQEIDAKYTIVPMRFLKPLLDRDDERTSIEIKLADGVNSTKVKRTIKEKCGDAFVVLDRYEQREGFYKIMKSEKLISYFILFFILLVAAANTVASLYLLMLEKKKDLRILSSIGLTRLKARSIFIFESFIIAATGGGIGMAIGVAVVYAQEQYGLLQLSEAAAFMYQSYPVELRIADLVVVAITVLGLGYITSLYPAKKAAEQIA